MANRISRVPFRRFFAELTQGEILILICALALVVGLNLFVRSGSYSTDVNSHATAAKLFVNDEIDMALHNFKLDTGFYPTTAQGLTALTNPPFGVSNWHGPYIKIASLPLDPWKNPYQYAFPSTHSQPVGKYDCWSNGPDGINGTDDDIGNWK